MVMIYVIMGILIVIGLIFIQFEHHTKKLKVMIVISILMLIFFSVIGFYNSGQSDFSSIKSSIDTTFFFLSWIWQSSLEIWDAGVEFTGKVVGIVR
jgi:glucan phosphoethanolaminetransferase (alkaline phosphatase superfamily)